jgi:hypothetical protein
MGLLFLHDASKGEQRSDPSARSGTRLKAVKKEKGEGRAPADLHPPLIVDKGARALRQAQGPGFTCGTVSEFVELAVKLKSFNFPLGAKSKGSNGVVAVGLPHRNYSVFNKPLSINRK